MKEEKCGNLFIPTRKRKPVEHCENVKTVVHPKSCSAKKRTNFAAKRNKKKLNLTNTHVEKVKLTDYTHVQTIAHAMKSKIHNPCLNEFVLKFFVSSPVLSSKNSDDAISKCISVH